MQATAGDPATPRHSTDPARLALAPHRAERAVLDGGWWPRSHDPTAEVPALVTALSQRHGPIRHLMLNSATWADQPRRITAGTQVVRMGWFATQDPALAIAITTGDDQLDLLVVPPATPTAAAERALAAAADPSALIHAGCILTTLSDAQPAGAGPESAGVWENEGGHTAQGQREPDAASPPATSAAAAPA